MRDPDAMPTASELAACAADVQSLRCAELAGWLAAGSRRAASSTSAPRASSTRIAFRARTLVPLHELAERIDEVLALPGPLVVHCEHGIRSLDASAYLVWQGRDRCLQRRRGHRRLAGSRSPRRRQRLTAPPSPCASRTRRKGSRWWVTNSCTDGRCHCASAYARDRCRHRVTVQDQAVQHEGEVGVGDRPGAEERAGASRGSRAVGDVQERLGRGGAGRRQRRRSRARRTSSWSGALRGAPSGRCGSRP